MQVDGGAVDLFGLIVLAILVNLMAALFAFGVAFRMRTIQAGPAMQMPVFLILFLAPVYVPLDLLSGWVHAAAKVNPFTALIEGGRDLISGQPFDAVLAYAIAAALVLAFGAWAVRGMRKAGGGGLRFCRRSRSASRTSTAAGWGVGWAVYAPGAPCVSQRTARPKRSDSLPYPAQLTLKFRPPAPPPAPRAGGSRACGRSSRGGTRSSWR